MGRVRTYGIKPVAPHLVGAGILWSWPEIAAYLRVTIGTAKRWHRHRPLPLGRIGSRVVTATAALDRWVLGRAVDEADRQARFDARAARMPRPRAGAASPASPSAAAADAS